MRGNLWKDRPEGRPGEGGSIGLIVVEREPEPAGPLRNLFIQSYLIAAKKLLDLDAVRVVGLRIDVPDERPRRPLGADERIFAADDIDVAMP